MTDEERKQAEDVMADNGFNFALFELENEHSAKNLLNAFEAYALKVAEATKEMYPKEFLMWIGFYSTTLYYRDIDEMWLMTVFDIEGIPTDEYVEYSTDELFEYWKQNISK